MIAPAERSAVRSARAEPSARRLPVRNPVTGRVDYEVPALDRAAVATEAERLRRAQPRWAALGASGRAEVLLAFAAVIERRQEAIAAALSVDTGRTLLSRREVEGAARNIRRWARLAPQLLGTGPHGEFRPSAILPDVSYAGQLVPYPLAGFISPWNFPVTLSLIDAVPALAAGSAALVKPSEITPRFVDPLRAALAEVPQLAEVLAFVTGDAETGIALVDEVDLVCFTGSVPTGRLVARQAAGRLIPAFLELGGKDPAIVLAGADLERATDAVLRGSVLNAGQVCLSIERIYVDQRIHDAFVERLVEKAQAVRLSCAPEGGEVGPIIHAPQVDVIRRHLADAVERGARIRCGGGFVENGGTWLAPTVVTHVNHGMALMREETFGPILPVMPFADEDEAVFLANDTDFGLSAAVLAESPEAALPLALRVNAGGISLNDCGLTIQTYEPEKTSFGCSGLGGSRMGPASIFRFVRRKALIAQRGRPQPLADYRDPPAETIGSRGRAADAA